MHRGLQQDELIDYAITCGAPLEVVENHSLLKTGEIYESMEEICVIPTDEDYLWNEDEK
jgi:hypothetical protein